MVPWVWLSGGGGTSLVGDHFVSTAGGWEFVLAGAVADWKGARAAGDEVKWGPDQCVAVMVSPLPSLTSLALLPGIHSSWAGAVLG